MIKRLQNRNAFPSPQPIPGFYDELEWYHEDTENLVGVLIHDNFDHDYSFVILSNKENQDEYPGLYCCIDMAVSMTKDEARSLLLTRLENSKTPAPKVKG